MILASAAGPEPVQSFVRKGFFEGVPYNQARLYSDDDVPELQRLLQDPAAEDTWRNVVGTLGAIGTERAKDVLITYLFSDPDGQLSPAAYIAKSDVPVALGWLVHKSDDREALELLINATDETGGWHRGSTGQRRSTGTRRPHRQPRDQSNHRIDVVGHGGGGNTPGAAAGPARSERAGRRPCRGASARS